MARKNFYGNLGRILHIDLGTGSSRVEEPGEEIYRKYLGGRGLTSYLLWREVPKGTGALSPENALIFGSGALGGTPGPSTGRTTVSFKSPASKVFAKSSAGGHFSTELKLAGYDALVIKGRAAEPVYVLIEDDKIEIRPATKLWGQTISQTHKSLYTELGATDIQVASIGPAGENGLVMSAIMFLHSAAGRTGGGCVMGSKNLKAVVVKGSGEIPVHDPKGYLAKCIQTRQALMEDPVAQALSAFGTGGFVEALNEGHTLPSYNFRTGHIDEPYGLSGQALTDKGYLKASTGCNACGIACHRFAGTTSGPYKGLFSGGPEYETASAFGSGVGITDTEILLRANYLANDYGMDTISTGGVIQFAIECFINGILTKEDLDGMELEWGNGDQLVWLIEAIAKREGRIPTLLGQGVKKAAEEIGGEAYKFAVQSKGMEQSRVETRPAKAYSLAFAVNPRGPDHLHTQCLAEFGLTPQAQAVINRITGQDELVPCTSTEYRAEIVRWHEDCYAVTEALGMCSFTTTAAYLSPAELAELYGLATGVKLTEEEIMFAGRRICTLEKCFNVREGLDRSADRLPWRLMNEAVPEGPLEGFINSQEELDGLLDRYYDLHGWDRKTSWPTGRTLAALGLEDVAADLGGQIGA